MELPLMDPEPYMRAVTCVLVHSLWQGILLGAIAAGALSLLRSGSARIRYAVSCWAMTALAVAVAVTAIAVWPDRDAPARLAGAPVYELAGGESGSNPGATRSVAAPAGDASSSNRWWNNPSFSRYFFIFWAAGVSVLSAYHLVGWRRARGFARRGTSPAPPEWQARFAKLCDELRIGRMASLLSSSLVKVPCVIGWLKPVVLVPVGIFTALDPSEIEMILVHELAHVRRCDVLVNILQTAMETLFFFNPAVWWLSRQIRIEREDCCDDAAILKTGDRLRYARALADLEEMRMFRTSFGSALAAAPLGRRIRRIIGAPRPRFYSAILSFCGMLAIASMIVVLLGPIGGPNESAVQAGENIGPERTYDPGPGDLSGEWEVETTPDELKILVYGRQSSGMYFALDRDVAARLSDRGESSFRIVRDAGTLFLEGTVEKHGRTVEGSGAWHFRSDSSYVRDMARYGLRESDRRKAFSLAVFDVSREYLAGMEACGLTGLNVDQLISARIFGLSPGLVEEFRLAGYPDLSYDKLLSIRVQGVGPEDAHRFEKLGVGHLTADQLISARIHGITPEFVREFREAGFNDLSFNNFVSLRAFNLDVGDFKACYRRRFMHLSEENMVWVCGFDITKRDIEKIRELGFTDIDDIIKMLSNDVTASYIRQMSELDYDDLTPSMLILLRTRNVTPSFVRQLQREGLKELTPEELIEHREGR